MPSAKPDLAKPAEKPLAEPAPTKGGSLQAETAMPTGSGVLGSRPRPAGGEAAADPEAAERRRFQRAIKEKS